jgi:tryptophan 2,3-dioxygenase
VAVERDGVVLMVEEQCGFRMGRSGTDGRGTLRL